MYLQNASYLITWETPWCCTLKIFYFLQTGLDCKKNGATTCYPRRNGFREALSCKSLPT